MDSLILRIFQGEPKQQGMAEYSLCWRSPRHHAAQQASNAPALSTPSASQGAGASKTTPVSCPLPVDMENSLCFGGSQREVGVNGCNQCSRARLLCSARIHPHLR